MAIWAITAYFNPGRFRRRYANYQAFRRALELPLLTVEWSPDGRFDLIDSDAEKVIRVSGGDLMWQKERLLNIAISELPSACDQVAWFDCDVVFSDAGWLSLMLAELQHAVVVQLFSQVVHLPAAEPESIQPATMHQKSPLLVRDAVASKFKTSSRLCYSEARCGDSNGNGALTETEREAQERERLSARPSSGHAWAARRELLADCGLYDACVCGVGDMATALAALGRPEAFVEGYPLNDAQQAHYLSWADRFGQAVSGQVSCLPATIFHLFHGRLVDRQYRTRLSRLANSGFDPYRQIRHSAQGAWEWAARDDALAQLMFDYFRDRREDD